MVSPSARKDIAASPSRKNQERLGYSAILKYNKQEETNQSHLCDKPTKYDS
jgi:hypothetical protein